MNSLNTTIPANGMIKLTTDGNNYWVYSVGGTATEIGIKTNKNGRIPHKAKTGFKGDAFTEIMLFNDTASDVDVTLLVGFGEYIDYS